MTVLQWFRKKEPAAPAPPPQPAAPKVHRLPVRVQPDYYGDFTEMEQAALMNFINSATGQKLLANLEHVIYLDTLSSKPMSEWQRGRIAGVAHAVNMMRSFSLRGLDEDEDEDDEDESAYPE